MSLKPPDWHETPSYREEPANPRYSFSRLPLYWTFCPTCGHGGGYFTSLEWAREWAVQHRQSAGWV